MKKVSKKIVREIEAAYQEHGQQTAIELAGKKGVPFEYCKACECESPHDNHTCIICGQATEKIDTAKTWQPVILTLDVGYHGNEYSDAPEKIKLTITEEIRNRIIEYIALVKKHQIHAIHFNFLSDEHLDSDGNEVDWRIGSEYLIVTGYGVYYEAQNKYDPTDTVECSGIDEHLALPKEYDEHPKKVLIVVEGGVVQNVMSDTDINCVLVDYDRNPEEEEIASGLFVQKIPAGETMHSSAFGKDLDEKSQIAQNQLKEMNF